MRGRGREVRALSLGLALVGAACGANPSGDTEPRGTETTGSEVTPAEPAATPIESSRAQTETAQTETTQTEITQTETAQTETEHEPATAEAEAVHARTSHVSAGTPGAIDIQIAIFERRAAELEQVAGQIAGLRPLVGPGNDGVPPICEDGARRDALLITARSGQAGSHAAASAIAALDPWCEPFERWLRPEEREQRVIRGYFTQLERIAGFMTHIDRCRDASGAERARCENAFDASGREAALEARRALALLDEHQRELTSVQSGAARFPCRTPVLARIEATTWVGTTARAQMGGLARSALSVCHSLEVDDANVREGERRVNVLLDRAESNARAERRQLLEAIESMRPYVE